MYLFEGQICVAASCSENKPLLRKEAKPRVPKSIKWGRTQSVSAPWFAPPAGATDADGTPHTIQG